MMRWLRGMARDQSGANAVEFALISAFVAFPLIFGGITGAWAWNAQQTLTHAAREGARFGATLPDPDDLSWETSVVDRTEEAAHGLDPDDLDVCVHFTDGGPLPEPGSTDQHCFADELSGPRVQVRVETPAQVFTAFLPEEWTGLILSSNAVARHEGDFDD